MAVYNGRVYGGGTKSTDEWAPTETFPGTITPQPLKYGRGHDKRGTEHMGTVVKGGKLILGSPIVGVALVTEGGHTKK